MIKKSIPNLLTMSNLFFGFLSIMHAAQGEYISAALFILIGMMFDSMDGRLARMLHVMSDFGKELDSLADIVTFGVAPAVLTYYVYLQDFGDIGMVIAGLFPLFGAYRLARFNVNTEKSDFRYFTGVPITAGGGVLTLLTVLHPYMPKAILPIAFGMICILMVSRLKIPSLKSVPLPKYGTIVTLFLGYALYLFWKKDYHVSPYVMALVIIVYVWYMGYQLVKKGRTDHTKTD